MAVVYDGGGAGAGGGVRAAEVARAHQDGGAGVGAAPTAEQRAQLALELAAEEAVDDEVERGVGGDEQVGDVRVAEVRGARGAARLAHRVVEDLVERRRRLADDERHDDDDHDERDVGLVAAPPPVAARRVAAAVALRTMQVAHQVDVDDDEDEERDEEDEDAVADVLVEDVVQADGREPDVAAARVPVLEEARHVVDADGGGGDGHLEARAGGGAEARRVQRAADRHVAVGGEQDEHPNGGHLGGVRRRPRVRLQHRVDGLEAVLPGEVDHHRRVDLDAGGGREEEAVGDRERLQEVGGDTGGAAPAARRVAREHGDGERVADKAEGADGAVKRAVDDEEEDAARHGRVIG